MMLDVPFGICEQVLLSPSAISGMSIQVEFLPSQEAVRIAVVDTEEKLKRF